MRNQRRQSSYHRLYALVLVGVALLALMISLAGKPQPASTQAVSCGVRQITNGGLLSGIDLSLSSDGTRIAFAATGNFTGGNPDFNREGRILTPSEADQLRDYWLEKFFATNETAGKELSRVNRQQSRE